jgi:hypothetical protein
LDLLALLIYITALSLSFIKDNTHLSSVAFYTDNDAGPKDKRNFLVSFLPGAFEVSGSDVGNHIVEYDDPKPTEIKAGSYSIFIYMGAKQYGISQPPGEALAAVCDGYESELQEPTYQNSW